MPWPKGVATHHPAQLGLPDVDCAFKISIARYNFLFPLHKKLFSAILKNHVYDRVTDDFP